MGERTPRTLDRRDVIRSLAGLGLSFAAADQLSVLDVDARKPKHRKKHHHKRKNGRGDGRGNGNEGNNGGGGGNGGNNGGDKEVPLAQVVFNGDRSRSNVFFTFDDGFEPDQAERVAGMANDAGVIISFFPIAKAVEESPELWRRIYNNHHIELHTYDHTPTTTRTPQELKEDVRRSIDIVGNTVQDPNYQALFFRGPYGDGFFGSNQGNKSTTNDLRRILPEFGINFVANWDVYTYAWTPGGQGTTDTDPETEARMLAEVDKVQNGSIILQHVRQNEADIFPRAVEVVREKGLTPSNMRQQI